MVVAAVVGRYFIRGMRRRSGSRILCACAATAFAGRTVWNFPRSRQHLDERILGLRRRPARLARGPLGTSTPRQCPLYRPSVGEKRPSIRIPRGPLEIIRFWPLHGVAPVKILGSVTHALYTLVMSRVVESYPNEDSLAVPSSNPPSFPDGLDLYRFGGKIFGTQISTNFVDYPHRKPSSQLNSDGMWGSRHGRHFDG